MLEMLNPTAAAVVALGTLLPVLFLIVSSIRSQPKSPSAKFKMPQRVPPIVPWLGNLVELLQNIDQFHDWTTSLCEKYQGEPFCTVIPGESIDTFVYTPLLVEEVLKNHFDIMPKGPSQQQNLRDLLGHGIFAVDGDQWVHQRKTASHLFTARALRDTMSASMRRYTVVLERVLSRARDSGEPIELFKLMNKFTIEAFAHLGFGIDMTCLEAEDDHPFQAAFDSAQRMLIFRFLRPNWFWKFQRFLNVGVEGQLMQDIAVIDKTVMDIIAQSLAHRQQMSETKNASHRGDIVSLFLDRFDASTGEAFDPKYLRDIVVNFLVAGRDTTAQAMSWCFYNLSRHPEVVAKIRAEIGKQLPEFASSSEPPTMEEVQKLTYLDATLKETLRLHPSVPTLPKTVVNDVVLADGTFLPAKSTVAIALYSMARMEFVWGPDAKQFKPERWIDDATGKIRAESQFKFASFNAGPRICLGMNLAMLEMKIVMASVLSHFDIELLPGQKITYDKSMTLPVRGPMLARVTNAKRVLVA